MSTLASTPSRTATASTSLVLVACVVACTSGEDLIGVGDGRDRDLTTRDGGSMDGSAPALVDGALPDGRIPGANTTADGSTGGTLPDGRPIDGEDAGSEPELDVSECSILYDNDFEVAVPFVEGGFAIAPGPVDFGLAYLRRDPACKHAIDTAVVDGSGEPPMPATVLSGCDTMVDVALGHGESGWHMAWTDNFTNTVELHTIALGDSLQPAPFATRTTITNNSAFEHRPVLSSVGGRPMVAWYADSANQRSIMTKLLDDPSEATEVLPASAGHRPIELMLAGIGPDHGAVAWVDEITSRGIWLQRIDTGGAPVGDPLRMTDYAAPGSTVDLARRDEQGGAAVYSVGINLTNFEVRFRRLNGDATFRGEEIKLISRPLQGKDAGVARLGGGYVVAYRAIPDGASVTQSEIRVVFVSKEGNLNRDPQGRVLTFPLVPASRDGSRIQVKVSVEGQLLVAFVDGTDADQNVLRVVRRHLDCGL